jgi:multiple sugar transport system ATP-binding protein
MIYVTHDQIEAMTLADRIAIMKGGTIQQFAAPYDIYNRPMNKYVAGFIGSPEMTFLKGQVDGDAFETGGVRIPISGYPFAGARTEGAAWFGIRPEHVETGEAARTLPFQQEAVVDIVEPMGSDTLVWTKVGGHDLRIRMDGQAKVRDGDKLWIGIDAARAHLFDASSEMRL